MSHLFGRIDEFTLRLPSALLAATGVLVTYRVAARLWGQNAGIVAGIVLLTCSEWWQAGTETQVDMTLAFFVTAACWYFDFLYHERDFGWLKALGLPLLLALATLAKGPVGLVLPGFIFFVYLCFRRDFGFLQKLHPFLGGLIFLVTAGSWYAAALWRGGPAFFLRQIVDENSGPLPVAMDTTSQSIITYRFSWKILCPGAFSRRWRFSFTRNATNYRSRSFYFH